MANFNDECVDKSSMKSSKIGGRDFLVGKTNELGNCLGQELLKSKNDVEKKSINPLDLLLNKEKKYISWIQKELGIEKIHNEYEVSYLLNLSEICIEKVRKIKGDLDELGIKIEATDIYYLSKLTHKDIKRIRAIIGDLDVLGIKIKGSCIYRFKLSRLTHKKIERVKLIKKDLDELGIKIYDLNIYELSKLTDEQIAFSKKLKKDGVMIDNILDKIISLTNEQIKKIGDLNELGIQIDYYDWYCFESLLKLTDEEIEKLKNLRKAGVELDRYNVYRFIDLTDIEIEKIERLAKLGVKVDKYNVDKFKDMTDKEIENLEKLAKLGVKVDKYNVDKFKDMTDKEIENLEKLGAYGVEIDNSNVDKFEKITDEEIEILGKLRAYGIKIDNSNVDDASQRTNEDIKGVEAIKGDLEEFGIQIADINIQDLKILIKEGINRVKIIKLSLDELGIKIKANNIRALVELTDEQVGKIKFLKKQYSDFQFDLLNGYELIMLSDVIITSGDIKNYLKRKAEYLEKNRTLSDEQFDKLFKNQLYKGEKDSGKYGIGNIHQRNLGYCYAYTGFELLKKSNFFDVLVKTSMKEIDDGWEVKLPLGDSNGHILRIHKSEIDKKYDTFFSSKIINSGSSLGFKILEIAFIKEYIINNHKYDGNYVIEQARNEYKTTGDITTINLHHLRLLEGGSISEMLSYILPKKVVKIEEILEYPNYESQNDNIIEKCKLLLKYNNLGNIKIGLFAFKYDTDGNKIHEKILSKGKKGEDILIYTFHGYSVEKVYCDEQSQKDIAVIVNPHNSSLKLEIPVDELLKIFNGFDISTVDINNMFK